MNNLAFWRNGWMRAWQKRKYPANIKPFGKAWAAGMRMLANNIELPK